MSEFKVIGHIIDISGDEYKLTIDDEHVGIENVNDSIIIDIDAWTLIRNSIDDLVKDGWTPPEGNSDD